MHHSHTPTNPPICLILLDLMMELHIPTCYGIGKNISDAKKITIEDVEQFKSKRICQPNKRSTVLFIHYDAMQRTLNILDRFSCLKDFEFRLRTNSRFS